MSLTLTEAQLDALADRVAVRVVERLAGPAEHTAGLIDAAEVARRYGIARSTVYDRAHKLGAVRIGGGPRPRLRFDPERVAAALAGGEHQAEPPVPTLGRNRRARSGRTRSGAPLLEVRGKEYSRSSNASGAATCQRPAPWQQEDES